MKKWRILFLAMSLSVFINTNTPAATQKMKALKAYQNFLSKTVVNLPQRGISIYLQKPYHKFALIYLNNDSIPELIISYSEGGHVMGYGSLYTYYNGKVRFVTGLRDSWSYYKKKGIIRDLYADQGYVEDRYLRFTGKSCKDIASSSGYYAVKNSAVYYNGKGKRISKTAFDHLIKQYVGKVKRSGDFYSYAHENTKSNRNKYIR